MFGWNIGATMDLNQAVEKVFYPPVNWRLVSSDNHNRFDQTGQNDIEVQEGWNLV